MHLTLWCTPVMQKKKINLITAEIQPKRTFNFKAVLLMTTNFWKWAKHFHLNTVIRKRLIIFLGTFDKIHTRMPLPVRHECTKETLHCPDMCWGNVKYNSNVWAQNTIIQTAAQSIRHWNDETKTAWISKVVQQHSRLAP